MRLDWLIAGVRQDCSLYYYPVYYDVTDRTTTHHTGVVSQALGLHVKPYVWSDDVRRSVEKLTSY